MLLPRDQKPSSSFFTCSYDVSSLLDCLAAIVRLMSFCARRYGDALETNLKCASDLYITGTPISRVQGGRHPSPGRGFICKNMNFDMLGHVLVGVYNRVGNDDFIWC